MSTPLESDTFETLWKYYQDARPEVIAYTRRRLAECLRFLRYSRTLAYGRDGRHAARAFRHECKRLVFGNPANASRPGYLANKHEASARLGRWG